MIQICSAAWGYQYCGQYCVRRQRRKPWEHTVCRVLCAQHLPLPLVPPPIPLAGFRVFFNFKSENHYRKLFCSLLTRPVNSICKSKVQLLGTWGIHIDIYFKKSNLNQTTIIFKSSYPQDQKAESRFNQIRWYTFPCFPKPAGNHISLRIKMELLGYETLTIIKHEGHYYSYLNIKCLICEQMIIFQTHSEAK